MANTSGKLLCIGKFDTISQEMVSSVIYCAVVAKLSAPIDSMMYILFTEEISCHKCVKKLINRKPLTLIRFSRQKNQ